MKRPIHTRIKRSGVYLFLGVVGIVAASLVVYRWQVSSPDPLWEKSIVEEVPVCTDFKCFLSATSTKMVAVSIDNAPEAWPQAGVTDAPLVFEIPVEGGRTRLFAWFSADDEIVDELQVGPVRSVRDAFLDVGAVCDVLPVHVGGSPSALARVQAMKFGSVDEFFNGNSFVRRTSRYAPHNTFISGKNLKKLVATRRDEKPCAPFGSGSEAKFGIVEDPAFDFGELSVDWRYSSSTEQYVRYNMNRKVVDEDKKEFAFASVLHLYTSMRTIDDKLRRDIDLTGSGTFEYFEKGQKFYGSWERQTTKDPFLLYEGVNSFRTPIQLHGPLWITILPE